MRITLSSIPTQLQGLKELGSSAPSIKKNLETRLNTPVLDDNTDIWATWLDSKTIQLYGGINEDKRHRFKIDHEFDLSLVIDKKISPDCSIPITKKDYFGSQGTEFIIISQKDVKGAQADYAIRADKYATIRKQLNKGDYSVSALEKAGGFKINTDLTPEEAKAHDGWLELAVGKNKAIAEDYEPASDLLKKYVPEAVKRNCFSNEEGMGFYIETNVKNYKSRPWFVSGSDSGSDASSRGYFDHDGRFLRVRDGIAAEGGDAALKIDPAFTQPYNSMVQGANVLRLPNGICYVRTHGPVNG